MGLIKPYRVRLVKGATAMVSGSPRYRPGACGHPSDS
jgi:hypothetical protein